MKAKRSRIKSAIRMFPPTDGICKSDSSLHPLLDYANEAYYIELEKVTKKNAILTLL
jgi:hypothetical protein